MPDWNNPNRFQLEALHEAILFAYPRPADLNLLLQFGLGKDYFQIAPVGESYKNALLTILLDARGAGWLTDFVKKAKQDKPQSPKLLCLSRNFDLVSTEIPDTLDRTLEDIVRKDSDFIDLIPWIQKLERLAWRTCRIEYPVNTAQGTGWLVGSDLLLTNWHVIEQALPIHGFWNAKEIVCRFDYAATSKGTSAGIEVSLADDWCIDASPPSPFELGIGDEGPTNQTLDYALIRLSKSIGNDQTITTGETRGWVKISKEQPLPPQHSIIFVIQHPAGLPIKLAVGDLTGKSDDTFRIFHSANTEPGASGSIILNAKLEPIALHHAGDLLYNRGIIGTPKKNQAVPLDKILSKLIEKGHWK